MSITQVGFIDVSVFTANYLLRHKDRTENGVLMLRDFKEGEEAPTDLPILKEWKSARAALSRIRAGAAVHFNGVAPELGKAWIEVVPPQAGTPWTAEAGDYADAHIRTRTCLVPSPAATTYCGTSSAILMVGIVTALDMRLLCSEVNHGEHARIHLVCDVKVPVVDAPES